jgi:hypothetical protein
VGDLVGLVGGARNGDGSALSGLRQGRAKTWALPSPASAQSAQASQASQASQAQRYAPPAKSSSGAQPSEVIPLDEDFRDF